MLKIIKKADIFLFVLLVILGLALSIPGFVSRGSEGSAGVPTVAIRVAGEVFDSCPLNQEKTITVPQGNHLNKVIIKDGKVQMEEATCHNQLCVKQGTISKVHQRIICIPNRVVVEIVSSTDGGDVDVISG